jgi:molybdopterin converting factor small subunit
MDALVNVHMNESEDHSLSEGPEEAAGHESMQLLPATRVRLHAAIDETFAELPEGANVEELRQRLNQKIEKILTEKDDGVVQEAIARMRERLAKPTRDAGLQSADLQFSDDVLAQLAEIDGNYRLRGERVRLAVLGALLEATDPQTPESLSQRTGYASGRMTYVIGSLNRVLLKETNWRINGRSTTGWTIERG